MSDADISTASAHLIAELAEQATCTLEIITIFPPDGAHGLPASVPIAQVMRGDDEPKLVSLAPHFEPWRIAPASRAGVAKTTTLASFIDLVKRHSDDDSAIFAATQWPNPKLTAVIDYHTTLHAPRFGKHRIEYAFPIAPEFSAWITQDGKPMPQLDFARFLEEHAAELAAPTEKERGEFEAKFRERFAAPNELIGLSRSLEVFVGAKIKRQERLATGDRTLVFEQTTTNAAGEPVDVPGLFMIALTAFVDGAPVRIPARLRFRPGAEVVWHYQLYRWQDWLRLRVKDDLAVAAQETGLPSFEGAPEA